MLHDEVIEDIKTYLQTIKKPRSMQIDSYTCWVKTLNAYISLMDTDATKITEKEMIWQVVLKGIPVTLNLDLKRVNNHKCATLAELQRVLKPIEEADEAKKRLHDSKKKKGGDGSNQQGNSGGSNQQHGNGDNGNNHQQGNSGDKLCRKLGHNHK